MGQPTGSVRPKLPKLAAVMAQAGCDEPAYINSSRERRSWLHAPNPLERPNSEVERSCSKAGIVPNTANIRRLDVDVLVNQTDEWSLQWAKHMSLTTRPTSGDNEPLELPLMAT